MKTKLVISVALLGLSLSATARADGDDEVTLKNGGSIRGTVVAVEPGSKVVVLELGSKEPRSLPWAEVADVQKGKFAARAEPGATAGYATDSDEEADADQQGVVRVHIESDQPVQLIEEVSTSVGAVGGHMVVASQVRSVCAAPCNKVVDASRGQQFVVVGDSMPPSETFRLNDRARDTTIKVDSGSNGLRAGSAVLGTIGVLGILGGVPMIIVGGVSDTPSVSDTWLPVGGLVTGIGAAMLGGAIAMGIAGSTGVEIVDGAPKKTGRTTERAARWWAGEF
jgi:hypothetical protein